MKSTPVTVERFLERVSKLATSLKWNSKQSGDSIHDGTWCLEVDFSRPGYAPFTMVFPEGPQGGFSERQLASLRNAALTAARIGEPRTVH